MRLHSAIRTLLLLAAAALNGVPLSVAAGPATLSVETANGVFAVSLQVGEKQFDLAMRPSAAVADVAGNGAVHLAGSVVDAPGSWARLSHDAGDGWVFGLVRHGNTLFSIGRRPSGLLWVDTVQTNQPAERAVSRVLPLAVVVDTAYNEAFAGVGRRRALALVNQLDGLYREQLGLGVNLMAARVLVDPRRDPMRQTRGSLEDLLLAFQQYRQADSTLPAGAGAVHLFSGVDVEDRRMGLAYIAGVCDPQGHDVSVSRTRLELVTLAHELAHSLGASHDQESACAAQGLLMDATVRRGASLEMSDCTVRAIQAEFARGCFETAPSTARFAFAADAPFGRALFKLPQLQGAVSSPEPVSPFALLVIAIAAVGLVRRRS